MNNDEYQYKDTRSKNQVRPRVTLRGYVQVYGDGSCFYSFPAVEPNPDQSSEPVAIVNLDQYDVEEGSGLPVSGV